VACRASWREFCIKIGRWLRVRRRFLKIGQSKEEGACLPDPNRGPHFVLTSPQRSVLGFQSEKRWVPHDRLWFGLKPWLRKQDLFLAEFPRIFLGPFQYLPIGEPVEAFPCDVTPEWPGFHECLHDEPRAAARSCVRDRIDSSRA
jgi:hypothetical protein